MLAREVRPAMPSRHRTVRLPFLVAAALLPVALAAGAACATGGTAGEEDRAEARSLRIQVRNRNFDAVTVFGETPGGRIRIGLVGANDSRVFSLGWTTPDDIRFLLRLESGLSCRSRTWYVEPGEIVTLTVAGDFTRSPACRGA